MSPFLEGKKYISEIVVGGVLAIHSCTYPSYPSTTAISKGQCPCRFQCLIVFVWLEKGADGDSIDYADDG